MISTLQQCHAHGFAGNGFVAVDIDEAPGGAASANGSVGDFNVDEHSSAPADTVEINGTLTAPLGDDSIHVDVQNLANGNKQYRGTVGPLGVGLQQLHQHDGSDWIIGNVGERQLSVKQTADAQGTHLDGTIDEPNGGGSSFINVTIDGSGNPHSEMIIPLLGLASR